MIWENLLRVFLLRLCVAALPEIGGWLARELSEHLAAQQDDQTETVTQSRLE